MATNAIVQQDTRDHTVEQVSMPPSYHNNLFIYLFIFVYLFIIIFISFKT